MNRRITHLIAKAALLLAIILVASCKRANVTDETTGKGLKSGINGQLSTSTLPFLKGVDLSYVNELEDNSVVYTEDGVAKDAYQIMHDHGANLVRLRLWHNPTWTTYSNLADVKISIQRAKTLNMKVLLDFHYSDTWTDPQQNQVPAAWLSVVNNTSVLADSLANYTTNVLTHLKNVNLLPDMVQIGNETNNNILVTDTSQLLPINWSRNVTLFNAGINAVAAFNSTYSKSIKTVLHVAMDDNDVRNWMSSLTANGIANFDMLGLSYYPQWQRYDTNELGVLVADMLSLYGKQVLIAETGHIWTRNWDDSSINLMSQMAVGYPETPCAQLQKDFLIEVKKAVQNNGGAGVIAWEPAWVSAGNVTLWGVGSNWENVAFFDFNNALLKPGGVEYLSDNNVAVTFRVDMAGVSTANGVFITGDFTKNDAGNWQFFPMKQVGTSTIYTFRTFLNPGQTGAYYFLNDDAWTARETVPSACQGSWTDRAYTIGTSASQNISYVWGSCTTF